MRKIFSIAMIFAVTVQSLASCGHRNYVASRAPESLQESAELDMEAGSRDSGRYRAAQEKLEKVLDEDPGNTVARSLLAASFAAQGGVVLLGIVTKLATSQGGLSGDPQALLWDMFPAPTSESLDFLERAMETMDEIPVASLTAEMTYQKGIFLAAFAVITLKRLREELLTTGVVTAESASAVLTILNRSVAALGGSASPVGRAMGTVVSALSNSDGTSSPAKVQEWLGRVSR